MRYVLLLPACLVPCLAQAATFQSFDVPHAYGTCGGAIASNGLVAGNTSVPLAIGTERAGAAQSVTPFLYAAGQFAFPHTSLLAGTVTFTGVNKDRFITGNAFSNNLLAPATVPFVFHHGFVSAPAAGTLPVSALLGITDRGVLLGESTTTTQLGGGFSTVYTVGFLRAPGGTITKLDDGSGFTTPRGMDAHADKVVGLTFTAGSTGWLFSAGAFTPVDYPGATLTSPAGVDEAGTVSGTYFVGDLSPGGSAVGHGFFLRHGAYTTFDVPVAAATSTYIEGMNEAEQITGCYMDAKGLHGFVRTP